MRAIDKVGVVLVAFDPQGNKRVFLRKNSPFNGSPEEWNVIYGHIEDNEDILTCGAREAREEAGVVTDNIKSCNYTVSKTFKNGALIKINYAWALFQEIPPQITLNEESIGYQWASEKEAAQLISDIRQAKAITITMRRIEER